MRRPIALPLPAALPAGCGGGDKASEPLPEAARSMSLTSPAFQNGGTIPARFTCDGSGGSPPLRWSGVPEAARELELVVEDPDADRFVHWTVLGARSSRSALRTRRSAWARTARPTTSAPPCRTTRSLAAC